MHMKAHTPNHHDTVSDPPQCECGLAYVVGIQDAEHKQYHNEYELGPSIPQVRDLPTIATKNSLRLVVVDNSIEEPIRKAIARVAEVAQRCMADYPFGYYGTATDENRRLYALVEETRIVGMVISSFDKQFWRLTWILKSGEFFGS